MFPRSRRVLHPRFWKACNINQMLTRHLYAGYEFWGKSTVKQNPETLFSRRVSLQAGASTILGLGRYRR